MDSHHVNQYGKYPSVCHYTSKQNALSILASNTIKASRADRLNDTSELHYSKQIINSSHKLNEQQKQIINILSEIMIPSSYIISCCDLNNELYNSDCGILSMWRYYGGEKSCYLEFDTYMLGTTIKRQLSNSHFCMFYSVTYNFTENAWILNNRITNLIHAIDERISNNDNEVTRKLIDWFAKTILVVKHPAFFEEHEVRFVIMDKDRLPQYNKNSGHFEFDVPPADFLSFKFEKTALKKIVLSPDYEESEMFEFSNTVDKLGYNIPIIKSQIPVRFLNRLIKNL